MSFLALLTALVAGFTHALEPDHMAAVTTFVARRPSLRDAVRFGARWGLGHSAALVAVGGLLVALDVRMPEGVTRGLEFGVGTMLVALAAWLLWTVAHERAHALAGPKHPDGGHAHAPHGAGWVGVLHGLAGTGSLIAVLQVTLAPTPGFALAYLVLFGAGTTVGMAAYAGVAGALFARGEHSAHLARFLRTATAVGSAVLGVFWMRAALAVA